MDIFSGRLRELRTQKGEQQADISKILKVSPQSYSAYENGREPSYDTLLKIAKHYDVSTDYLLGLSENKNAEQVKQLDVANVNLTQALKEYSDIEIRGRPAYSILTDVLNAGSYFYFALSSIYNYVEYDEGKDTQFKTMQVIQEDIYGKSEICEIEAEHYLNYIMAVVQIEIGNVCKYLRNKRLNPEPKEADADATEE